MTRPARRRAERGRTAAGRRPPLHVLVTRGHARAHRPGALSLQRVQRPHGVRGGRGGGPARSPGDPDRGSREPADTCGVRRIDVVSARDMLAAARPVFRTADALVMAAAVADYRPRRRLAGKWRVKDEPADRAALELVRNPDILATLGRAKARGSGRPARRVLGFALETGAGSGARAPSSSARTPTGSS